MDKKFETYTYSELVVEFKNTVQKSKAEIQTIEEKTEIIKKDLVLEMGKRKELEGIEKKKIAAVITSDLKELVSPTYIRNILSGVGQTDVSKNSATEKKRIRDKAQEEEKKILVAAGMGSQELEPQYEPELQNQPPVITNQPEDTADLHSLITNDNEIIDQRPQEEREAETNDAEEDIDKIHLIRSLKVENNNLIQQISDLEKLVEENKALRETIAELEKENTKLFNRNKELEEENNKLKAENRALRNPPPVAAAIPSMFSSKTHDDYLKSKRQNIIKGTKK